MLGSYLKLSSESALNCRHVKSDDIQSVGNHNDDSLKQTKFSGMAQSTTTTTKKGATQYFNRELSWLEFNQRVLDLAMHDSVPLLERVKFLAISASNLDEFFMVRVGGLKVVAKVNPLMRDVSGKTAQEQLSAIRERVLEMNRFQSNCLLRHLEPALAQRDIVRMTPDSLSEQQTNYLRNRFQNETLSVISPMVIESAQDFPTLSGARICMCVRVANTSQGRLVPKPKSAREFEIDDDEPDSLVATTDRFYLIPLGRSLERIWSVPSEKGYRYMLLEDIIGMFLSELFLNQEVVEWTALRVTRNGDVGLNEDGQTDLLEGMRAMLKARLSADCVRLTISSNASPLMSDFLQQCIEVQDTDIYPIEGPLALTDFFALANLAGFPELKDEPWPPLSSPDFPPEENIFDLIAEGDRMLHHPYQTYDPVVDFVRAAANDPNVIAIKQTLYRTSRDSPIVAALRLAAKNGKNVVVILELKARFDEARNIDWATLLEDAGVDVIYGVRGLKTHAKCCIVVRREPAGLRRYVHFATGNYNEATARLYGDISLFTCDEQLGMDAVHLFNAVTALSIPQPFSKLSAAPIDLRENLLKLIEVETLNAENKGSGLIIAKLNSLVDPQIIDALYQASQSGVKVRLNVRGICCLVPGKKNLSENIQVISIVDRFLEHSRIFYFQHAGEDQVFISSSDWMTRNLDRRVELMIPVQDPRCKSRLIRILNSYFDDNVSALRLDSEGNYLPSKRKRKTEDYRVQQKLYEEAKHLLQSRQLQEKSVFVPHRSMD
jgi:polyphosphate kinase